MKCFYHKADLDGHCSAAIVKMAHPYAELIGLDYGEDDFISTLISPNEEVIMVDYSLQPFSRMLDLNSKTKLIWIDHHKTAIEEATKAEAEISGTREIGIGACYLTWEFFCPFGIMPIPEAVQLLAEYDVWNHSDPRTLPLQYGLRTEDTTPNRSMSLWYSLFSGKEVMMKFVKEGVTILKYEEAEAAKYCAAYAFETEFEALPAIAVNRGLMSSQFFKSVYDKNLHKLMIAFSRKKIDVSQTLWTVSLYTTHKTIDCGMLAKIYKGGGHAQAAGFQCVKLPFWI